MYTAVWKASVNKGFSNPTGIHQGEGRSPDMPMFPLWHTILLGCVRAGKLLLNPIISKVFFKHWRCLRINLTGSPSIYFLLISSPWKEEDYCLRAINPTSIRQLWGFGLTLFFQLLGPLKYRRKPSQRKDLIQLMLLISNSNSTSLSLPSLKQELSGLADTRRYWERAPSLSALVNSLHFQESMGIPY